MKVDIQDVLFWMDAIRDSEDRYRTLESFWKGQVNSKIWLIQSMQWFVPEGSCSIVIHGGWNGVLASLLFNSKINIKDITSVDIDPACEEIAKTVNRLYEIQGRFRAATQDMCEYKYEDTPAFVINTSFEHITKEQYELWLSNVPDDSLIVLQSNNFFDCEEHVRCAETLDEFVEQSNLSLVFKGELETLKYTRYMIIGKKQ